jgi:hypothetical protein
MNCVKKMAMNFHCRKHRWEISSQALQYYSTAYTCPETQWKCRLHQQRRSHKYSADAQVSDMLTAESYIPCVSQSHLRRGAGETDNAKLKHILEAWTFGRIRKEVLKKKKNVLISLATSGWNNSRTYTQICRHIPMQIKPGRRRTFYVRFCTHLKRNSQTASEAKMVRPKAVVKNETHFPPPPLNAHFQQALGFSRILNIRDRTCHNCYGMRTFPNLSVFILAFLNSIIPTSPLKIKW